MIDPKTGAVMLNTTRSLLSKQHPFVYMPSKGDGGNAFLLIRSVLDLLSARSRLNLSARTVRATQATGAIA